MDQAVNKATTRIAILGAGMSGLGAAAKLKEAGYSVIDIFEKSGGVGGTWRDNTYPGCGCDVPSHLYSYSFELNPDWDYKWSLQPQILKYFEDFADKYDVRRHCRFNTEITECRWDDAANSWTLTDRAGKTYTADVLISGLGQLNIPHTPNFPGLDTFKGGAFHSARWDHSVGLKGKTVAVIGNGPSAVQFVPEIQKVVGKMLSFQRSPAWCRPRGQRAYDAKAKKYFAGADWRINWYRWRIRAFADFGFGAFLQKSPLGLADSMKKMCQKHLEDQVQDPVLREKLTPDFEPGCKRILISDDYYPALAKPNVDVLRQGIKAVTPDGVIGEDGQEYKCDAIIWATGFQSTEFLTPMQVYGRNGLSLNQAWKDGAEAFKGMAVSGFPNLFLLYGPNTNLGHNSIILMVEHQIHYMIQCIDKIAEKGVAAIDVTPSAMTAYNVRVQSEIAKTVWASDCHSWYKNEAGKVTNNWYGKTTDYKKETRTPDWTDFEVVKG
ncbi:putative 4-hydroxyacetophenone monooxygenase [Hyphomonas neptunium ATCC 15444]|uniref:Putative 4-hydroxyacetophenone monooxygenase n=2 Tax=Hyphomonas TaxID=85 RepID=Q0C3I9_HYPNA|nr:MULTISPECIES: NAD(P)/FAD-dependent oxidoreductase [Hyphomonas]ABI77646.1 putative 4-hydroxyacetophenone monooxygenase [Hyphomonas neptunium ATCC 15444]KCZ96087.1 putative 4-hydroxyacetophenone monooxygenase [Hyphomonas hirschiana VP5]